MSEKGTGGVTTVTRRLYEKYHNLPRKYQYALLVGALILGIIILPNTIVYAVGAVLAYKLIRNEFWKYLTVSVLLMVTFFSSILWIAGDAPAAEPTVPPKEEAEVPDVEESRTTSEETQMVEEEVSAEKERGSPDPVITPQQEVAPAQTQASRANESLSAPASAPSPQGVWYTSSHYSAKYYYHASCDGWQGLSPAYLRSYASEATLRAAHPSHALHPDCTP